MKLSSKKTPLITAADVCETVFVDRFQNSACQEGFLSSCPRMEGGFYGIILSIFLWLQG